MLRRLLRKALRRDALARDRRLRWKLPVPRPFPFRAPLLPSSRALSLADPDVQAMLRSELQGERSTVEDSLPEKREAARQRAISQYREALINEALSHPERIPSLHPQYLQFASAARPTKRAHPIATLLFVKLPLQFLFLLFLLFMSAYAAAYHFFNDERLGDFLSYSIGTAIDGELSFERVHWSPLLIFDLAIGRPHHIEIEGVRVYEAFKRWPETEKEAVTAYTERMEVDLVLHEIIPWNRIGIVPPSIEIPWILHFTKAHNTGEMWVKVREYQPRGSEQWLLSLVDAFQSSDDEPSTPGYRRLSIRVDDAKLPGLHLDLDLEARGEWATSLDFERLSFGLDYLGDYPEDPEPPRMPFRYWVEGNDAEGSCACPVSSTRRFPLGPSTPSRSARDETERRSETYGSAAPPRSEAHLRSSMASCATCSARSRASSIASPLPTSRRSRSTSFPRGRTRVAHARGRRSARSAPYPWHLLGPRAARGRSGLTLDLFEESAWAMDDIDASLFLVRETIPQRWQRHFPADPAEDGPEAEEEDGPQRWIVYLETFRGAALDGSLRLRGRGNDGFWSSPTTMSPLALARSLPRWSQPRPPLSGRPRTSVSLCRWRRGRAEDPRVDTG